MKTLRIYENFIVRKMPGTKKKTRLIPTNSNPYPLRMFSLDEAKVFHTLLGREDYLSKPKSSSTWGLLHLSQKGLRNANSKHSVKGECLFKKCRFPGTMKQHALPRADLWRSTLVGVHLFGILLCLAIKKLSSVSVALAKMHHFSWFSCSFRFQLYGFRLFFSFSLVAKFESWLVPLLANEWPNEWSKQELQQSNCERYLETFEKTTFRFLTSI